MDRYTFAFLIFCGWFVIFKMFPANFQSHRCPVGDSTNGVVDWYGPPSWSYPQGKQMFDANCARCHSGRLDKVSTGPALLGASARVPSGDWIYCWLYDSDSLIDSGEAYGNKIHAEYGKRRGNHQFQSLSRQNVDSIMAFIDSYIVYQASMP